MQTCTHAFSIIFSFVCATHVQVRAHVEQQIGLVAQGKADKGSVVAHTLEQVRPTCVIV